LLGLLIVLDGRDVLAGLVSVGRCCVAGLVVCVGRVAGRVALDRSTDVGLAAPLVVERVRCNLSLTAGRVLAVPLSEEIALRDGRVFLTTLSVPKRAGLVRRSRTVTPGE